MIIMPNDTEKPSGVVASSQHGLTSPGHIETAFYDVMFASADHPSDQLNHLEQAIVDEIILLIDQRDSLLALIPPLPKQLAKIKKALSEKQPDLAKIVQLVGNDPGLAGEVINLANSPYFRQTKNPIESLKDAVAVIGVDGVSNIATMVLGRKSIDIKPIYFRRFGGLIWQHSIETAMVCQALASKETTSISYFLGLIHDVGKIIIFKCITDCLAKVEVDYQPGGVIFKQLMVDYSLWLSCQVAAEWNLPENLCLALSDQQKRAEHKSPLGDILFKANLCSELHLLIKAQILDFEQAKNLLRQQGLAEDLLFLVYPKARTLQ